MATIRVHTTQNVTIEYEVASLGDRIVATLIDYALYVAWFIGLALLNAAVGFGTVGWIIGVLPTLVYFLVCEIFLNGQTLGKKARHTRVIRLDGTAASLGDYFLRWLLRPIDVLLFYGGVAVVTMLINGKGQRLGDLAAGTTVVSLRARPTNQLLVRDQVVPEGYQPVFAQAADLSDHDVALLRQLLSRALQQENYLLLNETATKIKHLLHLESDLGDEAFLRTILRDHAHLVAVE
ncbi:MAG: RDD family protein [Janthinobacterium lividum]